MLQMLQFTYSFCFFVCNSFVFLKIFFIYIPLNNDVRVVRILIIKVMTPDEEPTIYKLGRPMPNMYIHFALISMEASRALHSNQSYAQCKIINIKMN